MPSHPGSQRLPRSRASRTSPPGLPSLPNSGGTLSTPASADEEATWTIRSTFDSCIQHLKGMLSDQHNEWELEEQRALSRGIRQLRKLKKQSRINPEELFRVVGEIAETVSKIM